MTTSTRRCWLLFLFVTLAAVVGLSGCWICGEAILSRAGAWLDVGQQLVRTDFVLIFPGGPDTRPYVAAALLKGGHAEEALILKTKGMPDDLLSGYPPSHEIE